jgi:ubiquinone/menaquinone biosynthesis C-methylase UbiE
MRSTRRTLHADSLEKEVGEVVEHHDCNQKHGNTVQHCHVWGCDRVVANDEASYQYLVESIRRFPDQETFAGMVQDAGFMGVSFENLSGGIVAIHTGFRL